MNEEHATRRHQLAPPPALVCHIATRRHIPARQHVTKQVLVMSEGFIPSLDDFFYAFLERNRAMNTIFIGRKHRMGVLERNF